MVLKRNFKAKTQQKVSITHCQKRKNGQKTNCTIFFHLKNNVCLFLPILSVIPSLVLPGGSILRPGNLQSISDSLYNLSKSLRPMSPMCHHQISPN